MKQKWSEELKLDKELKSKLTSGLRADIFITLFIPIVSFIVCLIEENSIFNSLIIMVLSFFMILAGFFQSFILKYELSLKLENKTAVVFGLTAGSLLSLFSYLAHVTNLIIALGVGLGCGLARSLNYKIKRNFSTSFIIATFLLSYLGFELLNFSFRLQEAFRLILIASIMLGLIYSIEWEKSLRQKPSKRLGKK